ncbi:MAG: hypothetical protein FWH05_05795 [Oscillospiraceae bacterium]|nr:hypothetical protein [Oscillospiraceae bacterium]
MLKQISVFVENKSGRLCAITEALNKESIDLRSLSVADTTDFGIVRLIVNNTEKAVNALKDGGFTAKVTDVVGFGIDDKAGAFYEVVKSIEEKGINIEYAYSMMGKVSGKADIVVRTDNNPETVKLLQAKGINIITNCDI